MQSSAQDHLKHYARRIRDLLRADPAVFAQAAAIGARIRELETFAEDVDPARVRQRLVAVLETARAARAAPWPEKKQRVWQIMFPNMADWLPDDECNQLCFEFAREIERLGLAA